MPHPKHRPRPRIATDNILRPTLLSAKLLKNPYPYKAEYHFTPLRKTFFFLRPIKKHKIYPYTLLATVCLACYFIRLFPRVEPVWERNEAWHYSLRIVVADLVYFDHFTTRVRWDWEPWVIVLANLPLLFLVGVVVGAVWHTGKWGRKKRREKKKGREGVTEHNLVVVNVDMIEPCEAVVAKPEAVVQAPPFSFIKGVFRSRKGKESEKKVVWTAEQFELAARPKIEVIDASEVLHQRLEEGYHDIDLT
jgi:hypothetical protein